MISTRSVGLLIDTVVCLTLAKWETVSGRFGGYLRIPNRHQCSRFPGPLARQTRGTDRYQHLGQPERWVEGLIWPFSLAFGRTPSVGCSSMHDIERLTLVLVVAAAVALRSAAKSLGTFAVRWRPRPSGR